ncbi:MAG: hypothetical protein JNL62_29595, partial [Bryobacterales bacterium]|nr:hypothetical protein [Bryobacterales bacterium]
MFFVEEPGEQGGAALFVELGGVLGEGFFDGEPFVEEGGFAFVEAAFEDAEIGDCYFWERAAEDERGLEGEAASEFQVL